MVEVTQDDRNAAADILDEISSLTQDDGIGQVADLIRDGEYDDHHTVAQVAAHREAERDRAKSKAAPNRDRADIDFVLKNGGVLKNREFVITDGQPISITGSHPVLVQNCTFRWVGKEPSSAILISGAANATFADCTFDCMGAQLAG